MVSCSNAPSTSFSISTTPTVVDSGLNLPLPTPKHQTLQPLRYFASGGKSVIAQHPPSTLRKVDKRKTRSIIQMVRQHHPDHHAELTERC
ncbi:hypothetical protein CB1_000998010 [Camelus ferus]|nr:hypothetical protein CB1_000998010 [Camelus ferus]